MTDHTDCDLDFGFMTERVAALEAKLAASIESEREALELLRVSDAAHRTACNELANVTAECESETRWAHQYQREAETLRAEVARLRAGEGGVADRAFRLLERTHIEMMKEADAKVARLTAELAEMPCQYPAIYSNADGCDSCSPCKARAKGEK